MCANPFALYIKDNFAETRQKLGGHGVQSSQVMKTLGNEWSTALSTSEKDSYFAKASSASKINESNKEKYLESLKSNNDFFIHEAISFDSALRKGRLMRKDVYSDIKKFVKTLPAAPPATGRNLYLSEKLRGVKDVKTQMATVQEGWKNLSESERLSYDNKALQGMKSYESDLLSSVKKYTPSS